MCFAGKFFLRCFYSLSSSSVASGCISYLQIRGGKEEEGNGNKRNRLDPEACHREEEKHTRTLCRYVGCRKNLLFFSSH